MFKEGDPVVSFKAPGNPEMAGCSAALTPDSAFWMRGKVMSDEGGKLTLTDVERNSHVSGVGVRGFDGSSTKWYASQGEDGITLNTSLFQDDSEHKVSSVNQLVL